MKEEESIKAIDTAINELVYDKLTLQKAYNYYNGKRDMRQFQYLEENYGIGSPTSVKFTPLVRKHIDAIVGEYLDTAVLPKITCKDKATISAISTEKDTLIQKSSFEFLKEKLWTFLNISILKFLANPADATAADFPAITPKINENIAATISISPILVT